MRTSKLLQKAQEEIILISKRMTPEERLVAYFQHSQLMGKIYQAGVKYRSRSLHSFKKKSKRQ